jgi:hypothetical protein
MMVGKTTEPCRNLTGSREVFLTAEAWSEMLDASENSESSKMVQYGLQLSGIATRKKDTSSDFGADQSTAAAMYYVIWRDSRQSGSLLIR